MAASAMSAALRFTVISVSHQNERSEGPQQTLCWCQSNRNGTLELD